MIERHSDRGRASEKHENAGDIALRLYGTMGSASTMRALSNLRKAIGVLGLPEDALSIIDVFQSPEQAYADGVLATPMLVIVSGGKRKRVVGTLENIDQLLALFGANPAR